METPVEFEMVANSVYEYAEPVLGVSPTRRFDFSAHYDPALMPGYDPSTSPTEHAIRVFMDQGLTVEAPEASVIYLAGSEKFRVSARSDGLGAYDMNASGRVPLADGWGFSDEYFIVEYLDRNTGTPLARPYVTRFTVERDVPKPETASFSVDDQGVGYFSWDAVDGASEYYVVAVGGLFDVELVGKTTTETTLSTIEQDQDVQDALMEATKSQYALGVITQNRAFRQYEHSEDELRDLTAVDLGEAQGPVPMAFGVVAVVDGQPSSIRIAATGADTNVLPEQVAFNAEEELKVAPRYVDTIDQIPMSYPVTMSDGRTVLRAVILDLDNITNGEVITADVDDAGNYTNEQTLVTIEVPYQIDGTLLGGMYSFYGYDEATYLSELQRIIDRNLRARELTGQGQMYDYIAQTWEMDADAVSHTAPDVPYQITATNSFTEYLAANLLAGNEFIDVSAYLRNPGGISLDDAFDEAVEQNPLIGTIDIREYLSAEGIMAVHFAYDSHEELVAEQEAMVAEVDRVVGEIITGGMTDQEKAQAINDYIRETATYNYDALNAGDYSGPRDYPHAWSPAGILLDDTAVCAGYADAFKVLADAAGLESVVVSGTALGSGEGHAWNKVFVDNVWRMVDVTWNDNDGAPNMFFLLTDAQSAETRTEDTSWIVDSFAVNYAAL